MAVPEDRRSSRASKPRPPLDGATLQALALRYVERYATTRAKLAFYLRRKLIDRGWGGESEADVAGLVARFADLGYVDDRAFAEARGAALGRRGLGARRVTMALRAAGVGEADRENAEATAARDALAAALTFARRRRIGPFAAEMPDRAGRERAIAMLVRAGHGFDVARRISAAAPGTTVDGEDH